MHELIRVESLAEAKQHLQSHENRLNAVEELLSEHAQYFDTLQTRWWKRVWFRIDGWPGQRDLNASKRAWRPWHRGR